MIIKTKKELYEKVERRLKELHLMRSQQFWRLRSQGGFRSILAG